MVLYDASGNGNGGAVTSATWSAQGKFGGALAFNGSTSYVTIPNSSSIDIGGDGFTLEAWIKRQDTATRDSVVLGKDGPPQVQAQIYQYGLEYQNYGSQNQQIVFLLHLTDGTLRVLNFNTPYTVNQWQHVAVTYDGSTIRGYLNGALDVTVSAPGHISADGRALRLGADENLAQKFQGMIDELRIYGRTLSQTEIQTDMNTALAIPDAVPPAVAVASPTVGATVSGLVTLTATASDNVAVASVQYAVDGVALGPPAFLPPYQVPWDTTAGANGVHNITAIARDFAGNTTTSSAVAVMVATPSTAQVGQWSSPANWPIVTVHAALLPTGEVLAWDGQEFGANATLWNPVTNVFTNADNPTSNIFCSGHAVQADGKLVVAGGHITNYTGIPDMNRFDASTRTWTRLPSMSYSRWYPTVTVLPDGRMLVTAGTTNCKTCIVNVPELYDPATNTWTVMTSAAMPLPYYPHMYVMPDGKLLLAASDLQKTFTQTFDVASGTWTLLDPTASDGGSSVLYAPGKVMKSGSSADPDLGSSPSNSDTFVIDAAQTTPRWRKTSSMTFPRTYHNLTVLPDGSVLATGGSKSSDVYDLTSSVFYAELWSPATETWTPLSKAQVPRLYHSTALLLPDGRVFTGGSGRYGVDQFTTEIYSPPYLFKGSRPTIDSAPSMVPYGGSFTVTTADAARIASVSLIRPGSVTHAFNEEQRFMTLPFQSTTGGLTIQAPANANLAPPGYYMLFLVDTYGVPSVAAFVRLPSPADDSQPPTAPTNLVATVGSATVSLTWSPSTDNVAVTGYNVHRATAPGMAPTAANRIAQVATTTYTDSGLAGATYYYVVTARDAAGNVSLPSNEASAIVAGAPADTTPPNISVTAPAAGAVSGTVTVSATASDNVGVAGVQFLLDGAALGSELTSGPYSVSWNTTMATNGTHTLSARARDAAGNTATTAAVTVQVSNAAPSGPVAAYSFNEGAGTSAADSSGNNNTGTVTSPTWTAGKYGQSLSFNGSSSYVTVPNSTSLNTFTTGITIEAWVMRKDASASDRVVLGKDGSGQFYQYGLEYQNSGGQNQKIAFLLHLANGSLTQLSLNTSYTVNQWQHVALTYDGTTMKGYLNGVLDASRAVTSSVTADGRPFHIGADQNLSQKLNGLIDEVRIYNRALSAAEVQNDMNTPITSVPDTTPPSVSITAPAAGATVSGTLAVTASATDNVAVAGVQFRLDGTNLGAEVTAAPYSTSWNTAGATAGTHSLTAIARDFAGNLTTSAAVSVTVPAPPPPDTTPPTVSITAPATGATVSGTVAVTATAADNVGVAGVQFLLDGANLGSEVTKAPYSFSWNSTTVAAGAHTLSARARDAAGNTAVAPGVAVQVVLPAAPVLSAGYSFNEGAGTQTADASGNGNTGTITSPTWTTGKYGKALSFNGSSSYVTVPNSTSLNISGPNFTLEAWIMRKDTASQDRVVLGKDGTTQFYQFGLEYQNGSAQRAIVFLVHPVGGTLPSLTFNSSYTVNQWQHIAVTWDGTTLKGYLNGVLDVTQPLTGTMNADGQPLHIGADRNLQQKFSGLVDEIRIYNQTLTQAQIQADMNGPLP